MTTLGARWLAAFAIAALGPASAQAPAAVLLPAQSDIEFTIHQMGVPVHGKFGRFSAAIAFDPRRPALGSVSITIDTGSARFGAPELDDEIGKPEWLGAAKFPRATFASSSIKAVGQGRFEVAGRLMIKGQSHPIVVPVRLAQSGATSVASGAFAIKRLDFRVGEGEWTDTSMLGDEVDVRFKLALSGVPPL
jgi:polyisoprenoid-binding protein YceI